MSEENEAVQISASEDCAVRLAQAAETLERVIGKLEAQYEAINQKIDRIIATVEKQNGSGRPVEVSAAVVGSIVGNKESAGGRKTLPSLVSLLLAKSGMQAGLQVEAGALDRALAPLTIEQRIAVKAELARAGMIG
jgi:hypothetical protein